MDGRTSPKMVLDDITADESMLVELFDLKSSPEGGENWAETGRWIKYEEDVEGVDKHWGRPHVAFLTFHSLMQLKQCFNTGILLLDFHATDISDIISNLTSAMVSNGGIDTASADRFLNTLKVDRFSKDSSKRFSRRRISSRMGSRRVSMEHGHRNPVGPSDSNPDGVSVAADRKWSLAHHDDIIGGSGGANYAAKDPEKAEMCQVYAGVMPSLTVLRFFMVRLSEPMYMADLRSSYMPLRFMFIVAGPELPEVDYHELGRSIATLMADPTFKQVAFNANSREQLAKGIDHFLDFSVVIPPGDIDSHDLLLAEDVQKTLENRRKLRAISTEVIAKKKESIVSEVERKRSVVVEGPRPSRVDHVADSLRRTGRLFGGVVEDIKYRAPYYLKDFRDALHYKTVTATLFLFFANFASAVAFGEVMEEKTDGYMGATEMLMAHAVCGVIWGFIACQPLCIQAAVGPFLVLEASLFTLCKSQDLDFLAFRWWAGLWTFVLTVVAAMLESPFIMRYITRFTEDLFTSLIAFIFIWEAGKYLYKEVNLHPLYALAIYCGLYQQSKGNNSGLVYLNDTSGDTNGENHTVEFTSVDGSIEMAETKHNNQPNTALLSFILVIITFLVAFILKRLGTSIYFGRTIRKTLSDFGVPLAVLFVILIYQLFFKDIHITHVEATSHFSLTNASIREWIINPMGSEGSSFPIWAIFAAIVPAIFVAILLYLEVEIIESLLAKKERGLIRPHGFHWDLIVSGGLCFICAIFGMPWMCPGAVQSTAHAGALAVMKRTAPGAAPQLDYVVEQRISCMFVGILHGVSAFAGVVLVLIPVPVLFGLFLLLGVMGLVGIEFVNRLCLFFVPQKYFPDFPYCRKVSMWKMHLFTAIQLLCFGVLWAVNMVKSIALAFPFVLCLIAVFYLFVVRRLFAQAELDALDGKKEIQAKPTPPSESVNNNLVGKNGV